MCKCEDECDGECLLESEVVRAQVGRHELVDEYPATPWVNGDEAGVGDGCLLLCTHTISSPLRTSTQCPTASIAIATSRSLPLALTTSPPLTLAHLHYLLLLHPPLILAHPIILAPPLTRLLEEDGVREFGEGFGQSAPATRKPEVALAPWLHVSPA